jgi:uncharacterized protein (UPF0332 family)
VSSAPSSKTYLCKAEEALSGARLLLAAGHDDGACSRAYYAMFDAAHAALFALGVEGLTAPIKTHNGLVGKFGQYVIMPGHLPPELGSAINKLQILREVADYSGDPVAHDKAEWAVEQAEAFVAAIHSMIAKPKR